MKIICAGLPKTGTKSMASALKTLGYSVYDFDEQWTLQKDEFIKAFSGKEMPDFRKMYSDIDAVIDVPACLFYKEIFRSFPDAKVILVMREDGDVWATSILKTCRVFEESFQKVWATLALMLTPSGRKVATLWSFVKKRLTLDVGDRAKLCEFYEKHAHCVQSFVPPGQLLVMNISEGWQPLCQFLGVDVPEVAFPRLNVASSYVITFIDEGMMGKRMFKELLAIGAAVIVALAVVAFFM